MTPAIQIPPRLGFCASCVEDCADLRLGASPRGRLVWLCRACRTEVGKLQQYAGWHPGAELALAGMFLVRSKRSRAWVTRASRHAERVVQLAEAAVGAP